MKLPRLFNSPRLRAGRRLARFDFSDRAWEDLIKETRDFESRLVFPTGGVKHTVTVKAANGDNPAEILIHGPIGRSFYSNDGITGKQFTDELNKISVGTKVIVGVNSPGGAVGEGFGIYNAIDRRSDDITVRIDGYALSIASFFPLAASKVISPESSLWMIHNVWSWIDGQQGNEDDMRKYADLVLKAADMLAKHDSVLVAKYVERSGKSEKEIRQAMKDETYLTGAEAVEWGFADETSDNEPNLEDALDYFDAEEFQRIPVNCRTLILAAANGDKSNRGVRTPEPKPPVTAAADNSPAHQGADKPQPTNEEPMSNKLIALLKKRGITADANATIAALIALCVAAGFKVSDKTTEAQIDTLIENTADVQPSAPMPPQNAPANVIDLQKQIDELKAERKTAKEGEIRSDIQALVKDRRVPAAQADALIKQCVADTSGTLLATLKEWPQMPVAAVPVDASPEIEAGNGALSDIETGIKNFRAPIESAIRGNAFDGKAIAASAVKMTRMIDAHLKKIMPALNANTISADLKRIVILNQAMRAFKRSVLPLRAFATSMTNIPLRREGGLNKVVVPYYPLDTTASKDYVEATGYEFDQGTVIQDKEVTINKRKYKPFNFYSQEMARQPYFDTVRLMELKAEQLGIDVTEDIFDVVTEANYGSAVLNEPYDAFNLDDVTNIRTACNQSHWPKPGRSLLLDSAYEGNLLKDDRISDVDKSGSDSALREGVVARVRGFELFENPSIPENGENLVGMAAFMSAILVGFAPIEPAPGVRKQLLSYDIAIDPETGILLEYRYWGDPDKDEDREVVESNFGKDVGETAALKRITKP